MYPAIKGIYENGSLKLLEPAPNVEKTEVLVMFLKEVENENPKKTRILGGLAHLGGSIPDDFNDPIDDLNDYI